MSNIWQTLPKPIFCLAPMGDVTDSAFRQLLAEIGRPDLMFTEFVNIHEIINREVSQINSLKFIPQEQPLICQIWGNEPDLFRQAIKKLTPLSFAGIDLNFGCPKKAVVKKGCGAGLIGNYALAAKIISAAKIARLPLSVKTRLGIKTIDPHWLEFLLQQNLDALIVHCRTAKEMSVGPAHWEEITKAVQLRDRLNAKTLIIGNGDIFSREIAYQRIKETKIDGVMIGRGVFHNPWIFNSVRTSKNQADKVAAWERHLTIYQTTWGKTKPIHPLKRFLKVYLKGFKGALTMRTSLMESL